MGQPLSIKLLSFNLWSRALQDLADVQPYVYSPLSLLGTQGLANLAMVYSAGQLGLAWDPILNLPGVAYEVRFGPTWASARILGRVSNPFFATTADGTYWVAAYYGTVYGSPVSVTVAGTTLQQNAVATWDEAATSWSGAVAGAATIGGGGVTLTGSATSGTYTPPAGHIVDVGTAQPVTVSCAYAFQTSASANVSTWTSVAAQASIRGLIPASAGTADVVIQISIDPGTGTFGSWQTFIPGQYVARRIQMRAVLTSNLATAIPVLTAFAFAISLPTRSQSSPGPVSCPATGLAVTFPLAFQTVPNVQVTIANESAADVITFPVAVSNTGFTVKITNGGVGVLRNIHWLASGY
jgi:hypothetical protein